MMNAGIKPNTKHPTLFPYIQTGRSGIRIDFFPKSGSPNEKKPAFPFETLDHSDPLAHMVKAHMVTDAGSEIEHLLILLQRDQVQPGENLSMPATNPAIELCWQRAFSNFSKKEAFEGSLIQLGGQLTSDGQLQPFQPLLCCSLKEQFFPPPCPICGGLLDLCRADDMLASTGLHSYSNSLRRYLFCPTCYELSGETDFYTSLSDHQDGDHAKSYLQLIREFKKLAFSTSQIHLFPCRNCPEAMDCFEPNGPVSIRISTFAFYPFHVLIFKSTSVDTNSLFLLSAAKNDFASSMKVVEDPPGPDQNQSIMMILKRLITQWQPEAAEVIEKKLCVDSAEKPSRTRPPDPSNDQAAHLLEHSGKPDLEETMIAHANKDRSLSASKINMAMNPDSSETFFVGSKQAIKPGMNQPAESTDGKNHSFPSIPDAMKRNDTKQENLNIIPETMIIRPSESALLKSRSTHPAQNIKTRLPKKSKSDLLNDADLLIKNVKELDNLPDQGEAFSRTFRLGMDQIDQVFVGEKSLPSATPMKIQELSKLSGENQLDKTVNVQPKKAENEKNGAPAKVSPLKLIAEIKEIYSGNPLDAESRIQIHLRDRLGSVSQADRINMLQQIAERLNEKAKVETSEPEIQQNIMASLFTLLLGKKASLTDLKSEEQLETLAQALNTIFDTLNKLIDVINRTLVGTSSQQETIRGLIGKSLSNQSANVSLVEYLGQIEQAFLLSQKALKEAARTTVEDILSELDPNRIEAESRKGWFGPFRKADILGIFKEKHQRCRHWHESGRFEERLLREFEKSCSKHFRS